MTRITITTEQVEGIIARLLAGTTTVKDEAGQLGLSYQALRAMLEQVAGIETYFAAVTQARLKRMKLAPSKNFLKETAATGTDPV
jgi:hypothetical protein